MEDKPKSAAASKFQERSNKIEEQIREAEKKKQERQFLEELGKRISIAREGRVFIERKDFAKAMIAYRRFLAITAKSQNVEIAQLSPQLFEEKRRTAEALIISSIFFDLLKMLDRLNTPSAAQERQLYHKLFVRFTLGQPFQHFAGENIRKNLVYGGGIVNKKEFWATYHAIQMKKYCVVATWAFGDEDCTEVQQLREFRDGKLSSTALGRAFTASYYRNGVLLRDCLKIIPGSKSAVRVVVRTFLAL
ncbi:MAG: CFI-box-CTERM domain-containing protein [Bdellovibrionota bacterium]